VKNSLWLANAGQGLFCYARTALQPCLRIGGATT